ncbi:YopJ/AvrA family T3SS effector serine/threonine acetyltransferase [Bartonella phoceensis]|uniref:YopJ/AvrA family T3SS effector serine/threonine acetyltransferase n=1 Tax=Bartonella phoceensis TaxID=270249 RepID=UPI001ABA2CB6|nr:YopJ/AvrA family T3SS effector serine/threonine acetyltransferase [Bartonella phoceensis]
MKPRGSKNTSHSSSQTQEGACTSESLESLAQDLEKCTLEKETKIPFSHEQLKDIIVDPEKDIVHDNWFKHNHHYASTDVKMMPALIEKANRKHPGLNLKLITTSQDLVSSIKEAINNGVQSSRYIINTTDMGIHFVALDQRTMAGKTSLIVFEPTTFQNEVPLLLAIRIQQTVQNHLPECSFTKVEMDIQRSSSECGILSLALAKKLHTQFDKLTRMHEDNISGMLNTTSFTLRFDRADLYLPPAFYKHTQGARRLKEYIRSNPGSENEKVNKKDETLLTRFDKNSVAPKGKAVSVSLHKKRVSEYKTLML